MNDRAQEMGLREVWAILLTQRRLIAVLMGAGLGLSLATAFLIPPSYRADVLVAPTTDRTDVQALTASTALGGLAALTGVGLGGSEKKDEGVATLKSRVLIDAFVAEKNLLPILFARKWEPGEQRWRVAADEAPTLRDAHKFFVGDLLKVSEDRKSGLILVAVEWRDARQAAEWANDLVTRTNNVLRSRAIARAERNLSFLQSQLQTTSSVEVREAIYRLIEIEMKNAMLAQGSVEFVFKVIDPAVVPQERSRPKRGLIMLVGLVVSLPLAILVALLRSGVATRTP